MRLAILWLLGGCDVVFSLDDPSSGKDGGVVDDRVGCAQKLDGQSATPILPAGTYYMVSEDGTLATADISGSIEYAVNGAAMMQVGIGIGDEGAWLAPEGDLLMTIAGNFFQSHGYDGSWTNGPQIMFDQHPWRPGLRLSSPSTGRRHIILTDGTDFFEYRDGQSNTWTMRRRYDLQDLDVEEMSDPSLTSDGLTLVFRGRRLISDPIAIFAANRTDPDDQFGSAHLLHEPTFSVRTPFLRRDCELFYSIPTMGIVRVTPTP